MMFCTTANPSNFFTTYITPLASPLIALAVGIVAYQQWKTAQEKLRLDLYNRRFDVYSATIDLIQAMMVWASLDPIGRLETHRLFIKAALESQFLFAGDPSIVALLDEINTNAFIVRGFVEHIAPLTSRMGGQFQAEYQKKQDALEAIMASTTPLGQKLAPYLAFGQKQSKPLTWKRFNLGRPD
jgi:hypothetical protein